jgi:imidazolonepropionase-like amidohydrolase
MSISNLKSEILCALCGLCVLCGETSPSHASDEIPAPPQKHDIVLAGGTVHSMTGPPQRADVLLRNGKIVAIGTDVSASADAQRIDVAGKHVYPGLIDAATDIGLTEIGSVRATRDTSEAGQVNPNARAEVAVNPDSELIPVARANGVLLAVTGPDGGILSGTSALLQLDGWTWEDMTVKAPVAMELNWPSMSATRAWWQRDTERDQLRQRDERLRQVKQTFDDARAYMTARENAGAANGTSGGHGASHQDFDARWEAMIPLLKGQIPLAVNATDLQQIQAAVAFAQQEKVKLVIVGGADAPLCADILKKYDVAVIVTGTQRLPQRRSAGYDDAYALPARLKELGIRFCIAGTRSASYARNLPYQAGMAAAFGLDKDDAIKSITLYAAQVLGVADRVGSIEPGKDATLIVTTGDPLETPTQVEQAYIQGRKIELTSRHTRLWEKYKQKYHQQDGANGGGGQPAGDAR